MEDLNKEYEEILKERDEIKKCIEELEQKPEVIKYLELSREEKSIKEKLEELYEKVLLKKYKSCNHVLVLSKVEHDYVEGRSHRYYGCVKCGFDSYVYDRGYGNNKEEIAMLNIMQKYQIYYVSGTYTGVACKLADGRKLWNDIKEKNKDLDEEEIIQVFKKRCNPDEKILVKEKKN